MAEHWISAATALDLVAASVSPSTLAGRSLCRRAHAGVLVAKARVLLAEGKTFDDSVMPPRFWWAEGEAALDQNWASGDFSTKVDRSGIWRAFGVSFMLNGVLEMLSVELRAGIAHRLSVAGDTAWVPSRVARKFAYEKVGVSIAGAGTAILDHARLGFITGRAVLAQRFDGRLDRIPSSSDVPSWEEREWNMSASFWLEFTGKKRSAQDWERGFFKGVGPGPKGPCLMELSGVHFLVDSLKTLVPAGEEALAAETAPSETSAKAGAGGRPLAAWWDDMWCDVWGLIYEGKLIPKIQADVEKAMHTWAQDRGHSPAESTVRLKARKLFKVYSTGVENPPSL